MNEVPEVIDAPSPDRKILRAIEGFLHDSPMIADTEFDPNPYEPQLVRAKLNSDYFSSSPDSAKLEIHWFTNSDFSIQYFKIQENDKQWRCQWDKHPINDDTQVHSQVHFHHPPNGTPVENLRLDPDHPLDVVLTVLTAIEQHMNTM